MNLQELLQFVFTFSVTGFLGWLVYELRQLRVSIEKLNIDVAVVIRTLEYHEERLDRLEEH